MSSKHKKRHSRGGGALLPWENGSTKRTFVSESDSILDVLPFDRRQRDIIANSMSFVDILRTTEFTENVEIRRKHKWKALVNFYNILQRPSYRRGSIERALWRHDKSIITANFFATSLVSEFLFENNLNYDTHLRFLYLTFDGGKEDAVDWRDIFSAYQFLACFRLVRSRCIELVMLLFDIYTRGDSRGRSLLKEDYVMEDATCYIKRILLLPCVLDTEVARMELLMADLLMDLKAHGHRVTHREFQSMLSAYDPNLLDTWKRLSWSRLPLEMRLTVYDESQMDHFRTAENILMHHKLTQAIKIYTRNCCRTVFKEWKLEMLRESGVRNFGVRVLYRKRNRFFRFWDSFAAHRRIQRRRRILAEIMGNYSLKARCFARIKLFNYNHHRLLHLIGPTDKYARLTKLGGTHLREFSRLNRMKKFYHRWWNNCVKIINNELSSEHYRLRMLRWVTVPWRQHAHEQSVLRRMESVIEENRQRFDRMMKEAETDALSLVRAEEERRAKAAAEEALRQEQERAARLEKAKRDREIEKEKERLLILSMQQEERRNRVRRDFKRMRKQFKEEWEEKTEILLAKAKDRITAYLGNRDNKLAIDMNFEKVKHEFFLPPAPERMERERILTSVKNIMFLYIDAKLRADFIQLKDLIPRFDTENKGYLTYQEFKDLAQSIGAGLNNAQISAVIRGVDVDGDKCIDLDELELSMKETALMGVPGSPWKMYVDPAEDVICYHNFVTGQRVFEYQMKDSILREVAIANMYGEADAAAVKDIHERKEAEWDLLIKNYMAKRLQYLYRQRVARKWRQQKVWKVLNRELRVRTKFQKICVRFVERFFYGYKTRQRFKEQLKMTFEKVWDVETRKLFWFNHVTKQSTWDMPFMLKHYGDVTVPPPWIANPLVASPEDIAIGRRHTVSGAELLAHACDDVKVDASQTYVLHYWHVHAQKQLPRKPDGLPLCVHCQRNIAVHRCKDCNVDYCFSCHRFTHCNPLGFYQKTKATKKQYNNPVFVERVAFSQHKWVLSVPLRCSMCRSNKVCAGIHCDTCEADMCRACSNRIHHAGVKGAQSHYFYEV